MSNPLDRLRIRRYIREVECTDPLHHRTYERLRPLYLSFMDVLDHFVELSCLTIFLYKEESILMLLVRLPPWREREKHCIEGELELIFPLFEGFISAASLQCIESSPRLVVSDD